MPVTKTAKRAFRGSENKKKVNRAVANALDIAVRQARRAKTESAVIKAMSLADRTAKQKIIHKNKASRIKSQLSKLLTKKSTIIKTKKSSSKKVSSKKK